MLTVTQVTSPARRRDRRQLGPQPRDAISICWSTDAGTHRAAV